MPGCSNSNAASYWRSAKSRFTRAQVQRLLQASAGGRHGWRRDGLLAVAALVAVFAGARALDAQQARAQPLTVRAPFTVVDDTNKSIITVGVPGKRFRGMLVFSDEGYPSAQLTTTTEGDGLMVIRRNGQNAFKEESVIRTPSGLASTSRGTEQSFCGTIVKAVVELGNDKAGNGMLRIADMAGKAIVKVQEKGADPRGLLVLNAQAQIVAQATSDSTGAGAVKVLTPKGVAVGGLLALNQVEGSR